MSAVATPTGKRCTKCHVEQPIDAFSLHLGKYRQSWCRKCMNKNVAKWKREHRERARELSRKSDRKRYWESPDVAREVGRAKAKKYGTTPRPIKEQRAHWRIHELTRSGRLRRPERCEKCGGAGQRIEAHHYDYAHSERVEWLCSKCHGETRRQV